jgi:hypothetical protein
MFFVRGSEYLYWSPLVPQKSSPWSRCKELGVYVFQMLEAYGMA